MFSILLALAGGILLWSAYGISGFSSLTSAGAFPMAAAATMLVTSLVNLARVLRADAPVSRPEEGAWRRLLRELVPPVLLSFVAMIAAYLWLLERLGFVASTYLFLAVAMHLLGSRRIWVNLGVAALALGLVVVIFQTLFSVVLPKGRWLVGVL